MLLRRAAPPQTVPQIHYGFTAYCGEETADQAPATSAQLSRGAPDPSEAGGRVA